MIMLVMSIIVVDVRFGTGKPDCRYINTSLLLQAALCSTLFDALEAYYKKSLSGHRCLKKGFLKYIDLLLAQVSKRAL